VEETAVLVKGIVVIVVVLVLVVVESAGGIPLAPSKGKAGVA
jgi:hypothetical protein